MSDSTHTNHRFPYGQAQNIHLSVVAFASNTAAGTAYQARRGSQRSPLPPPLLTPTITANKFALQDVEYLGPIIREIEAHQKERLDLDNLVLKR